MSDAIAALPVAAAHAATDAAAELLRFATDGPCAAPRFGLEPETLERLADALKMAIEVEAPFADARDDREGSELIIQLRGALTRFLEGWA